MMNRHPLLVTALLLAAPAAPALELELELSQYIRPLDDGTPAELTRPLLVPGQPTSRPLTFEVQLAFSCPADSSPEQVTMTVGHNIVMRDQDLGSPWLARVQVPAGQLRMLRPALLCEQAGARGLTRLPELLTAFGSLVCRDPEGQQRAVTRAAPLDVWLACPVEEG